eukprot:7387198-Prymnesium_polylepis.1
MFERKTLMYARICRCTHCKVHRPRQACPRQLRSAAVDASTGDVDRGQPRRRMEIRSCGSQRPHVEAVRLNMRVDV